MHFLKFTRLRWRTRSLVLCTMIFLTILQNFSPAIANANARTQVGGDYGSEGDTSDTSNQNYDIYEQPQLEEEVEASEHRIQNDNDDSDVSTEIVTKMPPASLTVRKMSNNHIEKAHITNEHENNTEEEEASRRLPSSEEYSDEMNGKEIMQNIMRRPTLTTKPSEDVEHQVKAKQKLSHNDDNDAPVSEYTEETIEQNDNVSEPTNKNSYAPPEFARRKKTFDDPLSPMKFYQNSRSDSSVDEKKHKQLLPKRQNARNFNVVAGGETQNSEDSQYEEYYEDDNDDIRNRKDDALNRFSNQQKYNKPQQRRTTLPPVRATQRQPVLGTDFAQPAVSTWTEESEIENKTSMKIESANPAELATQASPTTASAPSTATSTTSTNSPSPSIPYGTTFPTPLARGPFTTQISSTTSFPSTLLPPSVISKTPDTLVPATTTTTKTTTTTTMRPGGKQGKQIKISRRKLQPHEKLRNYIEDAYIRMPLAVIVDPSTESLEKTKALWRDALRTNFNIKIVLVSLNASGAPAAYNFNNTRQFLAALNSIKEHPGGDAFIGVVHASELVPYDSAVFISTASLPPHTELVQDAAITLLKKRIRLYLLWFGERSLSENETQEAVGGILGEVAIRSGGDILHIVGSENSQELESGNTLVLVADAFRGSQEIEIPVDTTLSSLHVKIDSPTRTATLDTPNGG